MKLVFSDYIFLYLQASLASWVTLLRIMGDLPEMNASEGLTVAGVGTGKHLLINQPFSTVMHPWNGVKNISRHVCVCHSRSILQKINLKPKYLRTRNNFKWNMSKCKSDMILLAIELKKLIHVYPFHNHP